MQEISIYNIRNFGAIGDGSTMDTAAIQRAIDAAAAEGGGRVVLPAGKYLSGTIWLKSHVELHLSAGAVLVGSGERADYNADDAVPGFHRGVIDNMTPTHLVIAYQQEDVAITGMGTIDGNSLQFFEAPPGMISTYREKPGGKSFPIKSWRPGQMILFSRCRQVRITDVSLINAPYWTCLLLGCEDVSIRGSRIVNSPGTLNGDGFDIDCCRNVTLSDCIIRSGDDCITLRGAISLLGGENIPCENVVISNCVLSSPCNAIRVGVGDGVIRHCSFNNIVVADTGRAISIISRFAANAKARHGTTIENVHFSDFTIDACVPFSVHIGPEAQRPAAIRDISFSRFHITASAGSNLVGLEQTPIERVRMSDIDWCIAGGTDNCELAENIPEDFCKHGYTGRHGSSALPCVLYGRHLHDAEFNNIRIRWNKPSMIWRDGLVFDRCRDVEQRTVKIPSVPKT